MKPKPQGIEALTVRRANVADADKVRYRVYSTPTEFIAVIAESALMAVKVSGIAKPHKIVRDLPTEGIAIGARKMAAVDHQLARVSLPTVTGEAKQQLRTELKPLDTPASVKQGMFRPMTIGDLQHKGIARARILPPEMVNEIIEQHARGQMPAPVVMPAMPESVAAPVIEASLPPPVPVVAPDPKETLRQIAQEMPVAPPIAEKMLSQEEVEKLLNG